MVKIICDEPVIEVSVYSVSGKILQRNYSSSSIDITSFNCGVYFLEIKTNSSIYHQKLVKE
jgi:hypothetical protein